MNPPRLTSSWSGPSYGAAGQISAPPLNCGVMRRSRLRLFVGELRARTGQLWRLLGLAVLVACALLARAQETTPQYRELLDRLTQLGPDRSHTGQLRITNEGTENIRNLTVIFPGGRVEFGDIPAGFTTPYREVTGGVYRYAAYRLKVGDQAVTQPVIDWVGEVPMEGARFSYRLAVNADRLPAPVRLIEAKKDE
jgi:hypothetical protein